jgi:hypothetical protein
MSLQDNHMTAPQTPTQPPPKPTGPILEIPADLEIVYANLARISHSPADIVIDFAHLLPGEVKARIRSRVVMTPLSAKLFVRALTENIARYEAAFGEINLPASTTLADNLFRPFQQPPESPKE